MADMAAAPPAPPPAAAAAAASGRLNELLDYLRMEADVLSGQVESTRRENAEYAGHGEQGYIYTYDTGRSRR